MYLFLSIKFHIIFSKVAVVQEGAEPLPRCNSCIMHMPVGRLIKHKRTALYENNTHMRWRREDMAIAEK